MFFCQLVDITQIPFDILELLADAAAQEVFCLTFLFCNNEILTTCSVLVRAGLCNIQILTCLGNYAFELLAAFI